MIRIQTTAFALAALLATSAPAIAAPPQIKLQIKNRGFEPAELTVPAKTKVKLLIHNADAFPAEFESYDLSREVVVPGGGDVTVYIGPLDAGHYGFFNDFHPSSKGTVIAAEGAAK